LHAAPLGSQPSAHVVDVTDMPSALHTVNMLSLPHVVAPG